MSLQKQKRIETFVQLMYAKQLCISNFHSLSEEYIMENNHFKRVSTISFTKIEDNTRNLYPVMYLHIRVMELFNYYIVNELCLKCTYINQQ